MKALMMLNLKDSVSVNLVVLALLLAANGGSAAGQLLAPNGAGVSMGHVHMLVKDIDAGKKFWAMLGGKPIKIDGIEVMKFPGVFVFLTPGNPVGDSGNKGTSVDHPGFAIRIGDDLMPKLKAAGVKIEPIEGRGPDAGYAYTPDGLRVELLNNFEPNPPMLGYSAEDLARPIISDHLHYFLPEGAAPELQAWYAKVLGAKPLTETLRRGPAPVADIPGVRLRVGRSPNPPSPTKGHALDHVGFEVKNLEAFCKRLESSGVKFDAPYTKTRHKGFASAELTDPWGTSIELTEGLNRF
jgi:catechol 2,3-dioxygenase-like lactoylglutathione lyase family enzyme